MKHLKKALPVIGLITTVFTLFILTAVPVHAAGGLNISTTYPGTTVTAGKTTNFSLSVTNTTTVPMDAEVYINEIPAGWSAKLMGAGNQISRVYVQPEDYTNMTLAVEVPRDAKEGDYKLSVTANAGIAYDTIDMTLHVTAKDSSQGLFTSQFPELKGGATTTYTFNTSLTNNGVEDSYYSLSAAAPTGWTVGFKPAAASTDIASLTIAAGSSQSLNISVKPPSDVKAGEYLIPCTAISANDSVTLELKVIITGSYSMTITTRDGRMNAETEAGKESPVSLIITNTGSANLTNIKLISTLPTSGWAVRFDTDAIDVLPAGEFKEVIAYIQPDIRAITGDYAAAILAEAAEARGNIALRIAVNTSTSWGIVAVIIIVLLAAGLYFVFRKFGRR